MSKDLVFYLAIEVLEEILTFAAACTWQKRLCHANQNVAGPAQLPHVLMASIINYQLQHGLTLQRLGHDRHLCCSCGELNECRSSSAWEAPEIGRVWHPPLCAAACAGQSIFCITVVPDVHRGQCVYSREQVK